MKDKEIIKTEDLIFDYTVFDENGDELGDVSFTVQIEDLKLVKKA